MNIFEFLSFDFQEFVTSPPGILIILGILFLVVGLVMLMKEKKKNTEAVENTTEEAPATTEAAPAAAPVQPAEAVAVQPAMQAAEVANNPIVVPTEGNGVQDAPNPQVAETINFTEAQPANNVPESLVQPAPVQQAAPAVSEHTETLSF